MRYPNIPEYINALKVSSKTFQTHKNLKLVVDINNMPIIKRGKYGVIFKMTDGAHYLAVKCYLVERKGLINHMKIIQDSISWDFNRSPFVVKFEFIENEIAVNVNGQGSSTYPILIMDWVEGDTLDVYLSNHLENKFEVYSLAYNFSKLSLWLKDRYDGFAHGDLKPNNIIVNHEGQLVLVDYEGIYVKKLEGEDAIENGTEGFRLPTKDIHFFNETIDDYSIIVILLTLLILVERPVWLFNSSKCLTLDDEDIQSIILGTGVYESILSLPHIVKLRTLLKEITENGRISKYDLKNALEIEPNLWSYTSKRRSPFSHELTIKDQYGIEYSESYAHLVSGSPYIHSNNTNYISYHICPKTVVIDNGAFNRSIGRFDTLKKLFIPNSVKIIGDKAFHGCRSIEFVEFSEGIELIGDESFAYCASLTKIILPSTLNHIGNKAFASCENLMAINIPDNIVTNISSLFSGCNKLNINVSKTHKHYKIIDDMLLSIDGKTLVWMNRNSPNPTINIPDGVEVIESNSFANLSETYEVVFPKTIKCIKSRAFYSSNITSLDLPCNLEQIEDEAFKDCKMLRRLCILSNPIIGNSVFSGCINLKHVELSDEIESLPYCMFEKCENFTIDFGENIKFIDNNTFKNCSNIYVNVPESNEHYCSIEGSLYNKEKTKILTANLLIDYFAIPESVVEIGNYAFSKSIITSIDFHSKIEKIGSYAFYGCRNLRAIYLPNTVKNVGHNAFSGCGQLTNIILSGVAKYGAEVFADTYVDYLFIPGSLKELNEMMLYACNMKILHIGEGIETVHEYFIQNSQNIEKIILPNSLLNIYGHAFALDYYEFPEIEGPENIVSLVQESIRSYLYYIDDDCNGYTD